MQTRLPPELAATLQDITSGFEEELAQQCLRDEEGDSESDAPTGPLMFPSHELIAAINEAIQVRPSSHSILMCVELLHTSFCLPQRRTLGVL